MTLPRFTPHHRRRQRRTAVQQPQCSVYRHRLTSPPSVDRAASVDPELVGNGHESHASSWYLAMPANRSAVLRHIFQNGIPTEQPCQQCVELDSCLLLPKNDPLQQEWGYGCYECELLGQKCSFTETTGLKNFWGALVGATAARVTAPEDGDASSSTMRAESENDAPAKENVGNASSRGAMIESIVLSDDEADAYQGVQNEQDIVSISSDDCDYEEDEEFKGCDGDDLKNKSATESDADETLPDVPPFSSDEDEADEDEDQERESTLKESAKKSYSWQCASSQKMHHRDIPLQNENDGDVDSDSDDSFGGDTDMDNATPIPGAGVWRTKLASPPESPMPNDDAGKYEDEEMEGEEWSDDHHDMEKGKHKKHEFPKWDGHGSDEDGDGDGEEQSHDPEGQDEVVLDPCEASPRPPHGTRKDESSEDDKYLYLLGYLPSSNPHSGNQTTEVTGSSTQPSQSEALADLVKPGSNKRPSLKVNIPADAQREFSILHSVPSTPAANSNMFARIVRRMTHTSPQEDESPDVSQRAGAEQAGTRKKLMVTLKMDKAAGTDYDQHESIPDKRMVSEQPPPSRKRARDGETDEDELVSNFDGELQLRAEEDEHIKKRARLATAAAEALRLKSTERTDESSAGPGVDQAQSSVDHSSVSAKKPYPCMPSRQASNEREVAQARAHEALAQVDEASLGWARRIMPTSGLPTMMGQGRGTPTTARAASETPGHRALPHSLPRPIRPEGSFWPPGSATTPRAPSVFPGYTSAERERLGFKAAQSSPPTYEPRTEYLDLAYMGKLPAMHPPAEGSGSGSLSHVARPVHDVACTALTPAPTPTPAEKPAAPFVNLPTLSRKFAALSASVDTIRETLVALRDDISRCQHVAADTGAAVAELRDRVLASEQHAQALQPQPQSNDVRLARLEAMLKRVIGEEGYQAMEAEMDAEDEQRSWA